METGSLLFILKNCHPRACYFLFINTSRKLWDCDHPPHHERILLCRFSNSHYNSRSLHSFQVTSSMSATRFGFLSKFLANIVKLQKQIHKSSCSIIASKKVKFEISSLWTKTSENILKRKKLLSNPEKKRRKNRWKSSQFARSEKRYISFHGEWCRKNDEKSQHIMSKTALRI